MNSWLAKLRQDQRAAKADIAVIVSQALPKGVKHFELMDGVYVVSPQCVRPVAEMLRGLLVEVAGARQAAEGRETKAAVVSVPDGGEIQAAHAGDRGGVHDDAGGFGGGEESNTEAVGDEGDAD